MAQGASEWTRFLTRANQLLRTTTHPAAVQLPVEGRMPSLDGATGWLNSPPLTVAGLRGRVVLVNFWTYTCINWLRTLPYVRAWDEKYREQGLVVIGVHAPEFSFERNMNTCGSTSRSRSTTTMGSGMPSGTAIGRRSTSSTPRGRFGTTSSARASTSSPR